MPSTDRGAIGIDVGGTKIAAGIVRLPAGTVCARLAQPTGAERGGAAVLRDVLETIRRLQAEAAQQKIQLQGAGIGVAELIDRRGRVVSHATLDWETCDLAAAGGRLLRTCVEPDVRCAALAEARCGAGRGIACFLYVAIGTGISSCLVLEGRPYAGAHGLAGTMGSQPSSFPDESGRLVSSLALERYASGPALTRRLRARQAEFVGDTPDVCARAAAGDPVARQIVESAGHALGAALGQLVNVLDPERLVVGGGLGLAGGGYWDAVQKSIRLHTWSPLLRDIPLVPAQTGADAGWIGAALAAGERFP